MGYNITIVKLKTHLMKTLRNALMTVIFLSFCLLLSAQSGMTINSGGAVTVHGTLNIINTNLGLVAYYPFNGNANDESQNSYDGTVFGAVLTSDRFGTPDHAYTFDGINDYIEIPDCILQPDLIEFSYSLWVKANDLNPMLLALFHGSPCGESHIATGAFDVKLSSQSWYGAGYSLTNEWTHITGVYRKGNSITAYINGQYISSTPLPNENLYATNYTSSSIGSYWRSYGYFWNGKIDDVRIYNRALSDPEIQTLYHEGGWAK